MTKQVYLLLLLSLIIFSCQEKKTKREFVLPSEEEVNNIIKTIIREDSLPVLAGESFQYPVASTLVRFYISFEKDSGVIQSPSMPGMGISMQDLFYYFLDSSRSTFFSKQDTAYFRFLSEHWLHENHVIKSSDFAGVKLVSLDSLHQKRDTRPQGETAFCVFTNPIFSKDLSKVYIEAVFLCKRLCGSGRYYRLSKKNGKWQLVSKGISFYE